MLARPDAPGPPIRNTTGSGSLTAAFGWSIATASFTLRPCGLARSSGTVSVPQTTRGSAATEGSQALTAYVGVYACAEAVVAAGAALGTGDPLEQAATIASTATTEVQVRTRE